MSRVPPQSSGGPQEGRHELEHLEELGDDAIIAQQQGAHAPQPRVRVTEDARSIVIADHANPPAGELRPTEAKRRSRSEKTVVIRDRRQIDELRRELAKRKPVPPPSPPSNGVLLWVFVGLAAFLTGGLVAFFATRSDEAVSPAAPDASSAPAVSTVAPTATVEPPSVSIDELPIEGSKKK